MSESKAPSEAAESKGESSKKSAKAGKAKGVSAKEKDGEVKKMSEEDRRRALSALRDSRKRIYLELDKAKAEVGPVHGFLLYLIVQLKCGSVTCTT